MMLRWLRGGNVGPGSFEGGEAARFERSLGSSRSSSAQERSGPCFLGPNVRGGMVVVEREGRLAWDRA